MKVACVDSKYIYRISDDSEILIIFQRPTSVSKKQIKQVFDKIEELVKKDGTGVSSSDIIKHVNDSAFDESLNRTLFIYREHEETYISQDLLLTTFGNSTIELSANNTIIAKVNFSKNYYILKIIILLAVLPVLFDAYNKYETANNGKRIVQNLGLYEFDLKKIQIIENKYNEATNEKKIYSRFLQQEHSTSIQDYISSLKDEACRRFDNVGEKGDYNQLAFNEDSINTEILNLVSNAEECMKTEDNERKLFNTNSFHEDLCVVDKLLEHIDEKRKNSERYKSFIDQKALSDIETTILQIKNDINRQYNEVKENGIYTSINIKEKDYMDSIDGIFEEAFNKYRSTKKQKYKTKVTTPSPQKRKTSSERNSTRQSYLDLVHQADQDYKSFFYSNKNDKGAAQRAIMKYQKAQNMIFDSKIDDRIKKLQKEIK